MTKAQSRHYGADYDYVKGSPHLRHRHLYEFLTSEVSGALETIRSSSANPHVLEVGAGDGAISEHLLATGCRVTATEMSPASLAAISGRFGQSDRFRAVLDEDGDMSVLDGEHFDLVLFASVLHHIPDYLAAVRTAVDCHLKPGGALVSIQDPLWYARMKPMDHRISEACFISWRVFQGDLVRGVKTRLRRATRGLSEVAPGDAVEYHVVRGGVDEKAISEVLEEKFEAVTVTPYWSSQGTLQQRLGERLGLLNTFAIVATGHGQSDEGG